MSNGDLRRDAFAIHRATVRGGTEIAYVREGVGGIPLLMLHGWPTTKRIYYRNIGPLAAAGFEVIAPDIPGWGDSPLPAEGYAEFTSAALDFRALMQQLGHDRWIVAAFDFGATTALHMITRFPENIMRVVMWSAEVPALPDIYEAHGLGADKYPVSENVMRHLRRHGVITDEYVTRFPTADDRRGYVAGFYQGRQWSDGGPLISAGKPGNFDDEATRFHAEPFEDKDRFRASLHFYATLMNPALAEEPPALDQQVPMETMYLHGMDDVMVGYRNVERVHLAFPDLVGPLMIRDAGHFLSWEAAPVFNRAIITFCRDLLP